MFGGYQHARGTSSAALVDFIRHRNSNPRHLPPSYVRRHYSMGGWVRASQTTVDTSRLSEQGFGTSMTPTRVDDATTQLLSNDLTGTMTSWLYASHSGSLRQHSCHPKTRIVCGNQMVMSHHASNVPLSLDHQVRAAGESCRNPRTGCMECFHVMNVGLVTPYFDITIRHT
uniref:Uncharacterized protein n=1 Tax=Timema cristinae TaxID=61476 RepID=A0A7R9DAV6_TIMCR|nr:unnamed protein product [Timema cristinae]